MSHDTYELKAEARDRVGKGSARMVRRNGKIPAVIYGEKQAPLAIALSHKEIYYKIHGGGFLTTIATIDVDGQKVQVLPKDYQLDPVTDTPVHVDFLRIGKDTVVTVEVPVHFINEDKSPGIKRGGVLNIVLHEITVRTKPASIPEYFEVDLTGLEIGHSIHLSTLAIPEDVRVVSRDKNATVASIAAPTVVREAAAQAATDAGTPAAAEGAAAAPAAGAAAAAAPAGGAKAPAPAKK